MHLADLKSYLEADQRLMDLYREPKAWVRGKPFEKATVLTGVT